MKQKVCIMTNVHTATDVRIYQKQARTLREAGFDVVLLNAFLDDVDEFGIRFVKVPVPTKRMARMLKSKGRFYKAAVAQKADIYHFHDPELIGAGKKLMKTGSKVIYDSHEDAPRTILSKEWIPLFLRKIIAPLFEWNEKRVSRQLSGVIAATEKISGIFEKNGCGKVITIHNYPLLREFKNEPVDYDEKPNNACYIGGITRIRGIEEIVKGTHDSGARLLLAGAFETPQLEQTITALPEYASTEYLGFLDRNGVAEALACSRMGLVVLHPEPNYVESLPIKMFEYMAAAIPVIYSDFPFWENISNSCGGCGIGVNPLRPDEIRRAIAWILMNPVQAKQMGQRGRVAVLTKYNWEAEGERLVAFYQSL